MKCPKCSLEIDEDIMSCPMCQAELLSQLQEEIDEKEEAVETALLMTANDELQANIVESLLKVYGIPLRRKYKGNDTFGKIYMGVTIHGIDLYVPKTAIEEAKGIIANEMPEEQEPEFEESMETEEEIDTLKEKYENRRRSRAWIGVFFFIPGIFLVAWIVIKWILSLFLK